MNFDTRTHDGRTKLDAAIKRRLDFNGKSASLLAEEVGCTHLQARTSLLRLIKAGRASFEGDTRSTVYMKPAGTGTAA